MFSFRVKEGFKADAGSGEKFADFSKCNSCTCRYSLYKEERPCWMISRYCWKPSAKQKKRTSGEIRLYVENRRKICWSAAAGRRGILGVKDGSVIKERNNGVLVCTALRDHQFAILPRSGHSWKQVNILQHEDGNEQSERGCEWNHRCTEAWSHIALNSALPYDAATDKNVIAGWYCIRHWSYRQNGYYMKWNTYW